MRYERGVRIEALWVWVELVLRTQETHLPSHFISSEKVDVCTATASI